MKKVFAIASLALLVGLVALPIAQAQKVESTPVDLSDFWNADGWQNDAGEDPIAGTTNESDLGAGWGLDDGGKRVLTSSIPAGVVPGEVNVTEDGEVAFLLPTMNAGELDVYYPAGDTIPVPAGQYKYVYLACMSGNGTWPGNVDNWGADVDPDTSEVYDAREEVNSFKPIYEDGEGSWIPVGTVNDWFWSPPEWVAPESGDADEIIADYMTYEGDPDYYLNFVDGFNQANHDYGQYTYVDGEGDFIFAMEVPAGLTDATLHSEMWGNIKLSISTGDFADPASYIEIFNSVATDQAYPGGGDGTEPNREIRSLDISEYLTGDGGEIFFKFEDAAPDQLDADGVSNAFGPHVHQLGLYTGPVVKTRLGERLWPGLLRDDNASPTGGLILIKKKYLLDETKTLTSLVMPNNIPRSDPFLSIFAITVANEGTGEPTAVNQFMLF